MIPPILILNYEKMVLAYMDAILHIYYGRFLADLIDNIAKKSVCYEKTLDNVV